MGRRLVQVAYKNAAAVAFHSVNDIKSKHFSNVLRDSRVYIISCMCQPVAQELDKIHAYMRASL